MSSPESIQEESSPLRQRAQALSWQVKRVIEPVDVWVRDLARERPLVALAGALGIGYLVGRLIRRL